MAPLVCAAVALITAGPASVCEEDEPAGAFVLLREGAAPVGAVIWVQQEPKPAVLPALIYPAFLMQMHSGDSGRCWI